MFTNKLGSYSWWTSSWPILKSIGEGTAWCCLVLWIRQKGGSHHTRPGLYHHTPRASLLHSHFASFTPVVSLFWWGECKGQPPFRNTQSKSKQFKKKCVWCANAFKLKFSSVPSRFLSGDRLENSCSIAKLLHIHTPPGVLCGELHGSEGHLLQHSNSTWRHPRLNAAGTPSRTEGVGLRVNPALRWTNIKTPLWLTCGKLSVFLLKAPHQAGLLHNGIPSNLSCTALAHSPSNPQQCFHWLQTQ